MIPYDTSDVPLPAAQQAPWDALGFANIPGLLEIWPLPLLPQAPAQDVPKWFGDVWWIFHIYSWFAEG